MRSTIPTTRSSVGIGTLSEFLQSLLLLIPSLTSTSTSMQTTVAVMVTQFTCDRLLKKSW